MTDGNEKAPEFSTALATTEPGTPLVPSQAAVGVVNQPVNQLAFGFHVGAPVAPPNLLDRVTSEHISQELDLRKQIDNHHYDLALTRIQKDEEKEKRGHSLDKGSQEHTHSQQRWLLRSVIGAAVFTGLLVLILVWRGDVENALKLLQVVGTGAALVFGGMGVQSKLKPRELPPKNQDPD